MKYKKYGNSGETIIFLLGANNEPYWYDSFFQEIAKSHTIYTLNNPGINNDSKITEHTLANYLKYVDAVIKEDIKVGKYYLAGFSLGAYLAIKYYHSFGKGKVKGLILLSPMFKLKSYNVLSLASRFLLNEFQRLNHKNRKSVSSNLSPVLFKYISTRIKHSKFVLKLPPVTQEEIQDINYLAVVGDKDRIIDIDYVLKLLNPKRTIVYKGIGHDGFALEAERTMGLISNFT